MDNDDERVRLFVDAASRGSIEDVEKYLFAGVNIDSCKQDGYTALYKASSNGNTEMVKLLLKHNADPNKTVLGDILDAGEIPLHAVRKVAIAECLINSGANINKLNNNGCTPLYNASHYGRTAVVKLLLKYKAVLLGDKTGLTPLHVACDEEIAECLINSGAGVNRLDNYGRTPLYMASSNAKKETYSFLNPKYGKYSVVKVLLEHNANPNICTQELNTPLHAACEIRRLEVVECLVEYAGSDSLKAYNKDHQTPINILRQHQRSDEPLSRLKTYRFKRPVTDPKPIIEWLNEMGYDLDNNPGTIEDVEREVELRARETQALMDIELFQRAVERKGSVSYLMVQCMPFGPPRVGKTCVYNLLINRPAPGKPTSRRKIGKGSLSTDALTGRTIINARVGYRDSSKAIVAKGVSDWSEVTTLDDEIALYVETTKEQLELELTTDLPMEYSTTKLTQVEQNNNDSAIELKINHEIDADSSINSESSPAHEKQIREKTTDSINTEIIHENQQKAGVDQLEGSSVEDAVLDKITKPLVSSRKVDVSSVQSLVKDSLTIFYTDTGGQPEFQEVLPALIAGPTMFLLTFSLFSPKLVKRLFLPGNKIVSCDPLNALYQVRYDSSQDEFGNYESSFTVSDVLLQCLSSIACFKDGQTHQLMLEKDSGNVHISSPPISVLILGTHCDLVQQEDVEQVDQLLRELLVNVDLMDKGLVEEFDSGKQLIIPINNFDPNDGLKLQKVIERVVNRAEGKNCRSPYRIELPVHWLGLELYLRKLDQLTITYEECVKIAAKFDLPGTELKDCLKYLHYKTGTIRYYSGVEELKNTIIIKPSIIFSAITKLITSAFIPKHVKGSVQLKFKQYGLFKESEIQHVFEENEKSLQLTLNQFLALLRHLNILSRAYKMASHNAQDEPEFDYFLPCALTHAPIKDTSGDELFHSSMLVVSFQSGFVPKGIFSGLLACFSGLEWAIECHKGQPLLYRNQATFNINEHLCSLTMRAETKLLEFNVVFNSPDDTSFQIEAYAAIRYAIQKSLTSEFETLGYGQNWSLGVYCKGRDECQSLSPHVTTVNLKDGRVIGKCSMTNKSFLLSEEQQCWFKSFQPQGIPEISPKDLENVNSKIEQILTHRPESRGAKGIAFVTGITEADGVYVDLQNVKETFDSLRFIVYPEHNLNAVQLACLLKAAANFTYPVTMKFIAFYFAGHGGIDLNGKPFIVPLSSKGVKKDLLVIDHNILEPFRHRVDNTPLKNGKRRQCMFLFDCCLSESNMVGSQSVNGFKIQNPPPDSVVAYATAVGSKSFGDEKKGGVWTRHLCDNLTTEKTCLSKILINTREAVSKDFSKPNTQQLPHHEWNTGSLYLNGQPSLEKEGVLHKDSNRKSGLIKQQMPRSLEDPLLSVTTELSQSSTSLNDSIDPLKAFSLANSHSSHWRYIGQSLGLSLNDCDAIEQEIGSDTDILLEAVLNYWIESHGPAATWMVLITSLKEAGFVSLAENIQENHQSDLINTEDN